MKPETRGGLLQVASGDRTHDGTDPAGSRAVSSGCQAGSATTPPSPEPGRSHPGPGHPRPQEVDRHVAERVRMHRLLLGLTQQELAARGGVTYQQVYKCEKGIDRLTAGRLHAIAAALGVEVAFLFEGLADGPGRQPTPNRRVIGRLAHDFLRLPSRAHQEALGALARALATPKAPSTD